MILPGKITICELEEDNPQRSYFRVRPLMTIENGDLEDAAEAQKEYGDEGGIRIVPDKNDAMRFKSRMRTLGGYCLLDLTAHPGENEKIRPNKNYSPERGEMNRNIVYSDVIRACGDMNVMQVFESMEAGKGKTALTSKVLLKDGDKLKGPYVPEVTPDHIIFGFTADASNETQYYEGDKVCALKRGSDEVSLYISSALRAFKRVLPVTPETPRPAAPAGAEEPQDPAERPVAPVKPEPPKNETSQSVPAPKKAEPASVLDGFPPRSPRREEPKPDNRPHRDPLEGQVGLNPRRSRSLSEVVDYYWRQSRLEQLGAGVSGEVTSNPVTSPVEKARQAINEVWNLPEGRGALLRELGRLDGMDKNILQAGDPMGRADSEDLNRLEAEKLELLREIDKLKGDRIKQRSELMEETRAAHAKEIEELEKREKQLRDECYSRERAAQSARQAQAEAEKLLSRETKLKLDSEFLKFAMFTKAAGLIKSEENIDIDEYSGVPVTSEPTGAQMISDLRRAFEEGGKTLTNDEALNLLACAAIGSVVIFSGPTGCGKSFTAHAIAGALGLRQKGAWRFSRLEGDNEDVKKTVGFRELMKLGDMNTPRFMLLEDINMKKVPDQSRGLLSFADEAKQQGVTLMMTCLDDQIGYPLQPRLLDRAFFVRLSMPSDLLWRGARQIPEADTAPSLEAIRRVFLRPGEVPAEIKARMELLTQRLSEVNVRITPRALNDMYQYCSAVCPLMTGEKMSALDRAVAQRALPHIMATAKAGAIRKLPEILCDLPISLSLLNEPIALPPM